MKIQFNGQEINLSLSCSLADFLKERSIESTARGIAVAVNERIIRRGEWSLLILNEGDAIEVVYAVQGG